MSVAPYEHPTPSTCGSLTNRHVFETPVLKVFYSWFSKVNLTLSTSQLGTYCSPAFSPSFVYRFFGSSPIWVHCWLYITVTELEDKCS